MFPRLRFEIANDELSRLKDRTAGFLVFGDERVGYANVLMSGKGWRGSASVDEIYRRGLGELLVPN